jgi:hypothetical protein
MPRWAPAPGAAWWAGALAFAALFLCRQHSFWSDGRPLVTLVESGAWKYHIVAYLPIAHGARWLFGHVLGTDVEASLTLLSVLATALATGLVARAATWLGAGTRAAVCGALLFTFSPTVFFYGTCIEVHALQVLAVGVLLVHLARWERAGATPNAFALTLFFALIVATHMTGLLWTPVFVLYLFAGTGRLRLPRRLVPAVLLAALLAAGWAWLNEDSNAATGRIHNALVATVTHWSLEYLVFELFANGAALFVLLIVWDMKSPWRERRRQVIGAAALLLPFLVVVPAYGIEERGAYFASVFPVLGLVSALALERFRRYAVPTIAVLLPVQIALGYGFVWSWENDYRGVEWIEPLIAEADDNGLIIVTEPWEGSGVMKHSHLDALSIKIRYRKQEIEIPADDPKVVLGTLRAMDARLARGGIVAVARSVLELAEEREPLRRLLEQLAERYGEPTRTVRDEYLVYPARGGPLE